MLGSSIVSNIFSFSAINGSETFFQNGGGAPTGEGLELTEKGMEQDQGDYNNNEQDFSGNPKEGQQPYNQELNNDVLANAMRNSNVYFFDDSEKEDLQPKEKEFKRFLKMGDEIKKVFSDYFSGRYSKLKVNHKNIGESFYDKSGQLDYKKIENYLKKDNPDGQEDDELLAIEIMTIITNKLQTDLKKYLGKTQSFLANKYEKEGINIIFDYLYEPGNLNSNSNQNDSLKDISGMLEHSMETAYEQKDDSEIQNDTERLKSSLLGVFKEDNKEIVDEIVDFHFKNRLLLEEKLTNLISKLIEEKLKNNSIPLLFSGIRKLSWGKKYKALYLAITDNENDKIYALGEEIKKMATQSSGQYNNEKSNHNETNNSDNKKQYTISEISITHVTSWIVLNFFNRQPINNPDSNPTNPTNPITPSNPAPDKKEEGVSRIWVLGTIVFFLTSAILGYLKIKEQPENINEKDEETENERNKEEELNTNQIENKTLEKKQEVIFNN